ncbi:MAG: septal ring lytic transglycosylase RlpA family protein [Usitatibacteraceae bacterium]
MRERVYEPEFRSGLLPRVAQSEAGVSRSRASRLPNKEADAAASVPKGQRTWGRLLLVTFLGEARKVTCRRATPGIGAAAVALTLALPGCSSTPKKIDPAKPSSPSTAKPSTSTPSRPGAYYLDDGPGDNPPSLESIGDAIPRPEPLHRGANRTYTVFGRTYVPNVSNEPFRQQGIGSWYGRKFHGQKTSIGETYDMYAMTAAHPTLPLPCYVRVTNPANGKSVVVRVNDRGPFHSDRIIDLSYTAAAKLDYANRGSALVVVERVFPGSTGESMVASAPVVAPVMRAPVVVVASPIVPDATGLYLQLGAFGAMENAEIFRTRMARELDWNREPIQLSHKDNLYRVRMGPYKTREEADAIAAQVRRSHDFSPIIQQP